MSRDEALPRNIDWDAAAPYYDAFVRADFDLPYWLEAARSAGGEVLEVMCGTGRISLPLAAAGISLTALDASYGLLDRLRAKAMNQGLSVDTVEADARSFRLGKRFALVFIGFHAFAELLGRADRLRTLRAIHGHLAESGRFLLSLHNPRVRAAALHPDWRSHGTWPLEGGGSLEVSSRWDLEPGGIRVRGVQRYLERDPAGNTAKSLDLPIAFDLIAPEEVQSMAAEAGFRIQDLRGDYAGSPYDSQTSPYMLFTLVPCAGANGSDPVRRDPGPREGAPAGAP